MPFQNNDNVLFVPVTDSKTGLAIDPNDFVEASCQLTTLGGSVLFTGSLNDVIEVQGMEFKITIPSEDSEFSGNVMFEFQVTDALGYKSTLLQTKLNFTDTRIQP